MNYKKIRVKIECDFYMLAEDADKTTNAELKSKVQNNINGWNYSSPNVLEVNKIKNNQTFSGSHILIANIIN